MTNCNQIEMPRLNGEIQVAQLLSVVSGEIYSISNSSTCALERIHRAFHSFFLISSRKFPSAAARENFRSDQILAEKAYKIPIFRACGASNPPFWTLFGLRPKISVGPAALQNFRRGSAAGRQRKKTMLHRPFGGSASVHSLVALKVRSA